MEGPLTSLGLAGLFAGTWLLTRDAEVLAAPAIWLARINMMVALITLNPEETARFARQRGILVTDRTELTRHPTVVERPGRIVEAKNAELPSYARIKRFAVLPADFTEAGGELTPTQKVKRKVVAERYGDVIDSLYR